MENNKLVLRNSPELIKFVKNLIDEKEQARRAIMQLHRIKARRKGFNVTPLNIYRDYE